MRNWKKFMAVAMAATMVMGSSTMALAADTGTGEGTGSMEGTVSTDVWQVVVPTDAGTSFNFTLDPEGLIAKTNEEKYGGGDKYQDDATVFFENAGAGDADATYSSTSDAITLTNKGTQLAKVTLKAAMSNNDGITMASTDEFADTTVSLYLAMVDADGTETAITGTTGSETEATAVIGAAPEGAYEYKYDADGQAYEYALVDDVTGITFEEYSFQLTGACNTAANWSALADAAPKVTVTWDVAAYTPTGTLATFAAGTELGKITYTDGTDDMVIDEIISVELTNADGAFDGYHGFESVWPAATDDGAGNIVLDSVFVGFFASAAIDGKLDATVTYKTILGQTMTVVVEDVIIVAP